MVWDCKLLLSVICVAMLSACATQPMEFGGGDPVTPQTHKEKMLASARNAAIESQFENIRQGELTMAEQAYRTAPKDPYAALNYARLLRKVTMVVQADMVLKPFAINPETASESILTEYAKIKLSQGDFETAQIFAQESFMKGGTAESQMVLGISVDAQGHHQAAENHFRQALKNVGLDMDLKAAIQNNLALCLMAQGKKAEANSILNAIIPTSGQVKSDIIRANADLANKL